MLPGSTMRNEVHSWENSAEAFSVDQWEGKPDGAARWINAKRDVDRDSREDVSQGSPDIRGEGVRRLSARDRAILCPGSTEEKIRGTKTPSL